MDDHNLYSLKYPIGVFEKPEEINTDQLENWIADIDLFPERAKTLTEKLTALELNWRYRPGGWTIKQVVHHCADSHINSLMRFKLALTEENPTIRPYHEGHWAELVDSQDDDLSYSLMLLTGLHYRWTQLLKNLDSHDLLRTFVHPEHGKGISLSESIGMYAWHCNHHLAHIKQALANEGKF